jgi:hypothetical protein
MIEQHVLSESMLKKTSIFLDYSSNSAFLFADRMLYCVREAAHF